MQHEDFAVKNEGYLAQYFNALSTVGRSSPRRERDRARQTDAVEQTCFGKEF